MSMAEDLRAESGAGGQGWGDPGLSPRFYFWNFLVSFWTEDK